MDPAKSRREVPRDTAWARALASHPVDAATVLRGTLGGLPKYARSQAHRSRSLANRRPGRSARGGVSLGVYGCVAIAMTGKTAPRQSGRLRALPRCGRRRGAVRAIQLIKLHRRWDEPRG